MLIEELSLVETTPCINQMESIKKKTNFILLFYSLQGIMCATLLTHMHVMIMILW